MRHGGDGCAFAAARQVLKLKTCILDYFGVYYFSLAFAGDSTR
jgi:hypothetical protein